MRQALLQAEPPAKKPRDRSVPRLDSFKLAIDTRLVEKTTAQSRQRHTARRIFARLVDEHGATQRSYSTVQDHVLVRRPQIDIDAST